MYVRIPETISPFSYASAVTLVTLLNRRKMGGKVQCLNSFQSNFSATFILSSSYLFWAGKWLVGYL
jgi:hypothetical protein